MTITRRTLLAATAAGAAGAAVARTTAGTAHAAAGRPGAPSPFDLPVVADGGKVALPRGFRAQRLTTIGVEPLLDDRFGTVVGTTPSNLDGGAAFDVHGRVRYVRNHECRANAEVPVPLVEGTVYDAGCPTGMGGNTVVEVAANGTFVQQWVALSGTIRNCAGGDTPWGSWLACEEDTTKAGTSVVSSVDGRTYVLQKDHGYVFEVFPAPVADQVPLPIKAWGRAVWEGAEIGPDNASAYLTEDTRGGLLYRWTAPQGVTLGPGIARRLADDDGVLQAAQVVKDGTPLAHFSMLTKADVGVPHPVRWVDGGADRQAQRTDLRKQFPGATQHRKIEGCWSDGEGLWFTLSFTSEGEFPGATANQGMLVHYRYADHTVTVKEYYEVGSYFDSPDNITVSPWGGVVVAEDGSDPNHLIAFTERRGSLPLAKDLAERGEWAGPAFARSGSMLFASVQSDCTYVITGPFGRLLQG